MISLLFEKFPKKSFVRNFSLLLSTNLLVSLIGMFTSIYIARVLSPVHYGEYSVILAVIGMFQVFASLGMPTTITREVSRNQERSKLIFLASFRVFTFGFLAASMLLVVYLFTAAMSLSLLMIILLVSSLAAQSLWSLFENVAFGMQRMEFSGLINLTVTSLLFGIYMFLPKKYISVEAVLMVSVIAQLVKVILYYFVTSKNSLLTGKKYNKCSIETKAIQLVKMSMPFLFMGLFVVKPITYIIFER
jgi:O-antigen/teichoic acid export membrane protein